MVSLRVVIAPDSFKGSMTSDEAGKAIARGWRQVRPNDTVAIIPMADGGEGTLDIVHRSTGGSRIVDVGFVTGPNGGPHRSHYLALDDTTALVEMAVCSGITSMPTLDALGSTSRGLGETISAALDHGRETVVIALGGSASTDAGWGALEALGLRTTTSHGKPLEPGGGHLGDITGWDTSSLKRPQRVTILRDTNAIFLEAPSMFGPQKGASTSDVELLTTTFSHLLDLASDKEVCHLPGSGAAGGTGWGLALFLGADIVDGAARVGALVGLPQALDSADVVITGEGAFDRTSLSGKVTGHIIQEAASRGMTVGIVAGVITENPGNLPASSLVDASGDSALALADPTRWAMEAASKLAEKIAR
jgi:glycerate kinase